MPNTTGGGDKIFYTPWTTDRFLRLPAQPPAVSTTFYGGQAILRNALGNLIQCDDTQKGDFVGILQDFVRTTVDPTDGVQVNGLIGDKMFDAIQPQAFTALIAAAAVGDEGKNVFWQFNNQVSYSPGNNGNYAGRVWWVKDSTHVTVLPPWIFQADNGLGLFVIPPATSTLTLTKFHRGQSFSLPVTQALQINLPLSTTMGSGDTVGPFIFTGPAGVQVTIKPQGADLVNLSGAFLMGTAPLSRVLLQTDAAGNWYQIG